MKFDPLGVRTVLTPLFGFDTIIDTDIGLLNLIRNQYLDERVFKKDFFKTKFYQQLYELYHRKEENPLYVFAKDSENREQLDAYYHEFLDTCYTDILDMSISTEVYHLMRMCKNSPDFEIGILCKRQEEIDFLSEEEDFKDIKLYLLEKINSKVTDTYKQFFLKRLEDIEPFRELSVKTFYISSFGPNLNETEDDFRSYDTIDYMVKRLNNFSVYDIYDKTIIEKGRK